MKMETVSYLNVGGSDYELADKQARSDIGLKADKVELEKVASGSPAGVYANLSELQSAEDVDKTRIYLTLDNGNWNYWNGSSWVAGGVYQAVEIKNGSITQEKTDFIELTDNLLNKETVKKDYTFSIVDSTYKEKVQSDSFISDFIPVEQNELYRVYAWSYAVFDSDKSFISGQNFNDKKYRNVISTPNNASYVKFTGAMSSINYLFFAKLSSKKNINTYKLKNEDILQNIAEKSIVSEKLLFMKKPENNLFNNINNMYYCKFDLRGNIIYNQNFFISDFIKVEPNTEYHAGCFQAAFYDNNQTLLEMRDFNGNASNIFTTPNKTAFVRIVADINYENSIFITKSIFNLERGNDALNRVKYFFNKEYVSLKDFIATKDIKNKAVTGNKVDFLIPCGNLFDYKSDIIKGYQLKLNSNGDGYYAIQDNISFVSDFIEIEPDTEYKANAYDLIFWDKDKNFLSGTSSEKNNGNTHLSAISPSDARYATITGSSEEKYLSHLYLCKASNGVTPERKYTLSDNIIIDKLSNKVLNMPRYTKEVTNYNSDFPNKYYFMGRWELRNINEQNVMYTGYQGSKIYFVVKNTENITIELLDLNGVCTIAYKVDGKEFVRTTSSTIKISNLDKQYEHFIEIVVAGLELETHIWTNPTGCALKNITVDLDGEIKAISKKGKKILFYGDSITAGYRVYGTDNATQNGAEVNYVEQCCNILRADNIRCAVSGIGVFKQPSSQNVPSMLGNTTSNPMNTTYTKNSPIDLFRKDVEEEGIEPDFIILNLGTNDSYVENETFKEGYISMIKRIEQKYPGTEIFCLRPFNGSKETPILEATKECKNCVYVDTNDWGITYTDGTHPNLEGSKIAGEKLAKFLLNYFGKSYFLV